MRPIRYGVTCDVDLSSDMMSGTVLKMIKNVEMFKRNRTIFFFPSHFVLSTILVSSIVVWCDVV